MNQTRIPQQRQIIDRRALGSAIIHALAPQADSGGLTGKQRLDSAPLPASKAATTNADADADADVVVVADPASAPSPSAATSPPPLGTTGAVKGVGGSDGARSEGKPAQSQKSGIIGKSRKIKRDRSPAEITAAAEKARPAIVTLLRDALDHGRAEIESRLTQKPAAGHECSASQAFLVDQILRLIHDHVVTHIFPSSNPSANERIAIMAVGGYGRAEMAPHSDVDISFITPAKRTPWCEQVIETILYFLWDLGLQVGYSSRTPDEMVKLARADLTIRTALLEGRYIWGDEDLYAVARRRFYGDVVSGTQREFLREKLIEREARHQRMGGSRYVVEPNVKDGKGGLRDLQTLYWIGKYSHKVRSAAELVERGLFTRAEYRSFRRAEGFLLAVRCHLHFLTGRAEDRLTFDMQTQLAERMNFRDRPGKSAVERFMQFYFLQAKHVGSLTGIFLTHIDGQFEEKPAKRRGLLAAFKARARAIGGYRIYSGRIAAPSKSWFADDPIRLIEIFQLAEKEGLEIHPDTMRQASRDARLIKADIRRNPRANALFLDILTGRNNPETVLRWMNEAGVFGRFVPDFGRVNAQMQFDMYHHYTVDEHTIRAIGLLSRIEKGELSEDHPRSAALIHRITSRRAAYVAVLLHDIAKGRAGDHSILGEKVAHKLCPRFGLNPNETALVAWLVRHHLLMSRTAFKRDLADPKTIEDFAGEVQSLEHLRHLMMLTAVDIRAVGPGTWNSWKRQLLGELFDLTRDRLRPGHPKTGRAERAKARKQAVLKVLQETGDDAALLDKWGDEFPDTYWISEAEDVIAANLAQYDAAQDKPGQLAVHCQFDEERGATLVSVISADHPGLFYRIAGGIHLAGGNIIDARIHTSRGGWAVDNFLVQDPLGAPFHEARQIERIEQSIAGALSGKIELVPSLAKRPLAISRSKAFSVRTYVLFDNQASEGFTVIEVNARDRPALLNRLAHTLFENQLIVHSAHITAFGERAADTFYVTDVMGKKITRPDRLQKIETALLEAASDRMQRELEQAS